MIVDLLFNLAAPETSDYRTVPKLQPLLTLCRQPKVTDPINRKKLSDEFTEVWDHIYQNNFSVNNNTPELENKRPLCSLINVMDGELKDYHNYKETDLTKRK